MGSDTQYYLVDDDQLLILGSDTQSYLVDSILNFSSGTQSDLVYCTIIDSDLFGHDTQSDLVYCTIIDSDLFGHDTQSYLVDDTQF